MSIDFILPDIGEGIVECEIAEWLVSEGDKIVEDQPVAEVMTDKALVQIPAMYDGVVEKLYYAKGDIAKVHAPLFAMIKDGHTTETEAKVNKDTQPAPVAEPEKSVIREDFILPDIGEGIVECEIAEWLVNEGDVIEEDQAVAEVTTDKAMVQIPAMHAGKVVKLYYAQGEIAKVHAPLFAIERVGNIAVQTNTAVQQIESSTPKEVVAAPVSVPSSNGGKAVASPAVRRVARELGVNIHDVPGTGKKGRVYKDDVVNFSKGESSSSENVAALTQVVGQTRVEPIKGIKAAMAKQMMVSASTIPHFTYCEEIDMTNLIALRNRMKDIYAKKDIKLTMMPFFMKAMSLALKEFPLVNSQVNDDCTELTYFDDHNIGMAVDSKVGLLVPNVKHVQTKSIVELANDITRLTNDAREGRVAAADLKGGTITISNIGAIGGTVATPIINKPEVAIVALGKLQTLPRFSADGQVEARSIMQVSWSGDHRVLDGGTIARFCNLWKAFLESPEEMLMHMA